MQIFTVLSIYTFSRSRLYIQLDITSWILRLRWAELSLWGKESKLSCSGYEWNEFQSFFLGKRNLFFFPWGKRTSSLPFVKVKDLVQHLFLFSRNVWKISLPISEDELDVFLFEKRKLAQLILLIFPNLEAPDGTKSKSWCDIRNQWPK